MRASLSRSGYRKCLNAGCAGGEIRPQGIIVRCLAQCMSQAARNLRKLRRLCPAVQSLVSRGPGGCQSHRTLYPPGYRII